MVVVMRRRSSTSGKVMGQSKHKNRFFGVAERLFAQLGSVSTDLEVSHHDEAILALCRLTQQRWFDLQDTPLHTLYARSLHARDEHIRRGLTLFLDSLLGRIWPSADSADPELDLFVAVPCQVLPFLGDVIGDFDHVEALAQSMQLELEQTHQLQGLTVHLDCGLFDVDPFEGWPGVVQSAYVAKNPSLRESHGRRQCFRFSDSPAVAPVTRTMWARLSFQSPEQLGHAIRALSSPVHLHATKASLPYTVGSVTGAGAQQLTSGVRALAVGPAFDTLVQWAFEEGRLEVAAASRDLCQRHSLRPEQLKATVVVVEQPSIALPEGVVGSGQTAASVGKSDPQVQVLFSRAEQTSTAGALLGRALFSRATPRTLEVVLQHAVRCLGELELDSVELGQVSSRIPT